MTQEQNEKHFVGLVVQKAAITREGNILMVKNRGDKKWDFPGGRLNSNEVPIDGLAREVREEIGCDCQIGGVIYMNQYRHESTQKQMFLIVHQVQIVGEIELATDELSEVAWINPTELKEAETFTDYVEIIKLAMV